MSSQKNISNYIILDANFILLPAQFKINYFSEINDLLAGKNIFFIYQQIFDELEAKVHRESKKRKFQRQYQLGKRYLEQNSSQYSTKLIDEVKKSEELTDEFLLRKGIQHKSQKNNVYIATNDMELRKLALKNDIGVIFLRQKKYLTFKNI